MSKTDEQLRQEAEEYAYSVAPDRNGRIAQCIANDYIAGARAMEEVVRELVEHFEAWDSLESMDAAIWWETVAAELIAKHKQDKTGGQDEQG